MICVCIKLDHECACHFPQAQFIWWLNAICFLAHTTMVFLTLYFAYWRWGSENADHMMIKIYRISSIPTREMVENNITEAWDNSTRWSNDFYLYDNGMPINFATLTLSFFLLSAIFHFIACVLGLWEGLCAALTSEPIPFEPLRSHGSFHRIAAGSGIGANSMTEFVGGDG